MIVSPGLRMGEIVIKKFVESSQLSFAGNEFVRRVIRSVVGEKLLVITRLVVAFVLVVPAACVAVERDESGDEITRLWMRCVLEQGDVGVVEEVLVVDLFAVEDFDDVCLVLEVRLGKLL